MYSTLIISLISDCWSLISDQLITGHCLTGVPRTDSFSKLWVSSVALRYHNGTPHVICRKAEHEEMTAFVKLIRRDIVHIYTVLYKSDDWYIICRISDVNFLVTLNILYIILNYFWNFKIYIRRIFAKEPIVIDHSADNMDKLRNSLWSLVRFSRCMRPGAYQSRQYYLEIL